MLGPAAAAAATAAVVSTYKISFSKLLSSTPSSRSHTHTSDIDNTEREKNNDYDDDDNDGVLFFSSFLFYVHRLTELHSFGFIECITHACSTTKVHTIFVRMIYSIFVCPLFSCLIHSFCSPCTNLFGSTCVCMCVVIVSVCTFVIFSSIFLHFLLIIIIELRVSVSWLFSFFDVKRIHTSLFNIYSLKHKNKRNQLQWQRKRHFMWCLCLLVCCAYINFFISDFARFSNDFLRVTRVFKWYVDGWLVVIVGVEYVIFFSLSRFDCVLLITMIPTIFDCCNLQLWKKIGTHIHNIHYYDYWCNSSNNNKKKRIDAVTIVMVVYERSLSNFCKNWISTF